MVNTSLRCARGNHAWLKAIVYSRPLGSALHHDRRLHVVNTPGPIFNDHISTRLAPFLQGSLVADRWPRDYRDADGANRFSVPAMGRANYRFPLSSGKGSF